MKKFFLLFAVILFLTACQSNVTEEGNIEALKTEGEMRTEKYRGTFASDSYNNNYFYLTLNYMEDEIQGYYQKADSENQYILEGAIEDGVLLLDEYDGDAFLAEWVLETDENGKWQGDWYSPDMNYPIFLDLDLISSNFSEFNGHYVSDYDNAYIDLLFFEDGSVKMQGDAWWQGVNPDNIHIGNFAGFANYNETYILYKSGDDEYDCVVEIFFENENSFTATDNNNCGGANVSFSGEYKKESETVPNWFLYNDFYSK